MITKKEFTFFTDETVNHFWKKLHPRYLFKELFIWEVGQDKKQDGAISVLPLYRDFFNKDKVTRPDGVFSVPTFQTWIT